MAWLTKFHSSIKSLQVRICRITIYYIKEILPIIKAILQNIRGVQYSDLTVMSKVHYPLYTFALNRIVMSHRIF